MNNNINLQKIARKVLETEINSLQLLESSITEDFISTIHQLFRCKGRIIVTGIGKSALVGSKIAATFNSIGCSSTFMHATDAIHGDIGMILPNDIVLLISKSGETPEVKVLLPLLKDLKVFTIGMTAYKQSTLAKNTDAIFHTPINKEADPFNKIPTSSIVNQIAMGDIIAMLLLELQGFTERDFAKNHPGGMIGKQLYLKVGDLSSGHDSPSIDRGDTMANAVLEISSKRLGAVAVLSGQKLIGIITDGDLRRAVINAKNIMKLSIEEVMTKDPISINIDDSVTMALSIMKEKSIGHLIVLDDGKYAGIIHIHDIIKEGFI